MKLRVIVGLKEFVIPEEIAQTEFKLLGLNYSPFSLFQ
jgi:hypothetical protein